MKKYFLLLLLILFPFVSSANDDKVAFTITPPLIKNNVNPGQIWKSSIKLVNNNPDEISAYINVVDFKGGQNDGTIEFINFDGSDNNEFLLSNWIVLLDDEVVIPPFQSKEISFIVEVPENADPGGHYAAILAGSKPSGEGEAGSSLKISTLLSSLLLLNVKGEVREEGMVREFSVDKSIYNKPDINFLVRFQNMGNVHIQPQGEIKVFNFLDKEVGSIPLNHKTEFGNVLPDDIRKWNFNWKGDDNIFSMGRYKAMLILQYGNETKETVDQTLFFWVIYTKPVVVALSLLLFVIALTVFLVKRYIRKTVEATHVELPKEERTKKVKKVLKKKKLIKKASNVKGVVDLKEVNKTRSRTVVKREGMNWSSMKMIFLIIIIFFVFIAGLIYLFTRNDLVDTSSLDIEKNVSKVEDTGNVKVDTEKKKEINDTAISNGINEDLIDENINIENNFEEDKKDLQISIQNGNGTKGLALKVVNQIKNNNYNVVEKKNANNFNYKKTIIQHKEKRINYANEIDSIIGVISEKELLSEESDYDLVIIIGANYK